MSAIGSPERTPSPGRPCATGCTLTGCAGRPSAGRSSRSSSTTDGHVTGAELVERCREVDPATTPSTVYRTLDVLEGLGLVSHSHGVDGREEFHVLPVAIHGHLHCTRLRPGLGHPARRSRGRWWTRIQRSRGFAVDVTHLSIAGTCAGCAIRSRASRPGCRPMSRRRAARRSSRRRPSGCTPRAARRPGGSGR